MAIRYGASLKNLKVGDKLANPIIAKSIAAGAANIGAERHYTVLGEDFTVELNQEPKDWVKGLTDPTTVIFSTIYAGSIFHFAEKLQIQTRALNVAKALEAFAGEATVLEYTMQSIEEEVKLLDKVEDLDEMSRIRGRLTAKQLKAQRVTRAMENNINALLYLGNAGSDDILLEQLREANLEDNVDDLKVWQSWVDNPPKGIIDEKLLGLLNQLADPEDLMGIKASVNKSKALNDEIIQFLTRVEKFQNDSEAIIEAWRRNPAQRNIDELGRALKGLNQGELAGFFGTVKKDLDNVKVTMRTIATASEDARKIGKKAAFTAKTTGRFFFWDTVYWIVTSVVDVALNPFLPEDQQRIPYLADLPYIGGLFDVSEGIGTSVVDLLINWGVGKVIDWFVPDSIAASFYELLDEAIGTEDLAVWYVAVITFFYDLGINIVLEPLIIETPQNLFFEESLPLPLPQGIEPLDILAFATVACVAKIVFNGWVRPAWGLLTQSANRF